jgi:hypothetical protein
VILTAWSPTEKQRAALAYAQEHGYDHTVSALCQAIDVARQTYYGWWDTAEFAEWWLEQAERWFKLRLPAVYEAMHRRAAGGWDGKGKPPNMAAARLLLERFDKGFAPRSRQELSGPDGQPMVYHTTYEVYSADSDAEPAPGDPGADNAAAEAG